MANATDIKYGIPPSGSNTVDWLPAEDHLHVVSLSGSIDRMMTLTRVASGDISDGVTVVLNSDGTVSPAGKIPDTISDPIATPTTIYPYNATVYDSTTGRIIFAYGKDGGFYCVTGVVSGGSITFGVVNTVNTPGHHYAISMDYDSTNEKVVIMWSRSNGLFNADTLVVVGDIIPHATDPSLDSMAFGTILDIDNYYLSDYYDVRFDSLNGVMFMTRDTNRNTTKNAFTRIASVSGTVLTWGQTDIYKAGTSYFPSSVYDPDEQKVILIYIEQDGINNLWSVTGTVSITGAPADYSVTYNTPDQVSATGDGNAGSNTSITYDPINKRVVAFWRDFTGKGKCCVGIVDGDTDSVSWGTPTFFSTEVIQSGIVASYDTVNEKVVVQCEPTLLGVSVVIGEVDIATETCNFWPPTVINSSAISVSNGLVYDPASGNFVATIQDGTIYHVIYDVNLSNLQVNGLNFLGVSQLGGANDGEWCVVGRYGFLAENVSGLTPATQYYLDEFGDFVTYNTQGPYAGLAITDTTILIKG